MKLMKKYPVYTEGLNMEPADPMAVASTCSAYGPTDYLGIQNAYMAYNAACMRAGEPSFGAWPAVPGVMPYPFVGGPGPWDPAYGAYPFAYPPGQTAGRSGGRVQAGGGGGSRRGGRGAARAKGGKQAFGAAPVGFSKPLGAERMGLV